MSRACFKVIQEKENLESTSAFARYYIYLLVYALKYNVIIPVIDSFIDYNCTNFFQMASQNQGKMEPVQNILLPIFSVSVLVQTGDSPSVEVMTADCHDLKSFVFDSNT